MWLSLFTHTNPWPPPGAGVALTSAEPVVVAAAGLAVAFGLNSEPIFENGLAGDADAAGVAVGDAPAFLRARRSAGEADAAELTLNAGDASGFLCPRVFAGETDSSGLAAGAGEVSAFLRPRVFAGEAEASGLVTAAGEASAFFLRAFFAGEADASGLALGGDVGLCAPTKETPAKIIIDTSRARFVVMKRS